MAPWCRLPAVPGLRLAGDTTAPPFANEGGAIVHSRQRDGADAADAGVVGLAALGGVTGLGGVAGLGGVFGDGAVVGEGAVCGVTAVAGVGTVAAEGAVTTVTDEFVC
ncbi:hypothetical protein GCM10027408_21000 [Microbacterium tumbae]